MYDDVRQFEDIKKYYKMSDNLSLEIKTVQSAAFRVLTEALKEILTDTNVDFDGAWASCQGAVIPCLGKRLPIYYKYSARLAHLFVVLHVYNRDCHQ